MKEYARNLIYQILSRSKGFDSSNASGRKVE